MIQQIRQGNVSQIQALQDSMQHQMNLMQEQLGLNNNDDDDSEEEEENFDQIEEESNIPSISVTF